MLALHDFCRSERLHLRQWRPEDAEEWYGLSQDEGLNQFNFKPYRMADLHAAQEFIRKWTEFFEEHSMGIVPIVLNDTDQMVGICAVKLLQLDDEPDALPELMYRLAEPYWEKGLATEACHLNLRYAFFHLDIPKIIAVVDAPNVRSQNVLQKLGFLFLRDTTYQGHPYQLHVLSREQYRPRSVEL